MIVKFIGGSENGYCKNITDEQFFSGFRIPIKDELKFIYDDIPNMSEISIKYDLYESKDDVDGYMYFKGRF